MKKYLDFNVYEASLKRIELLFDNFEYIYISVSSGKDSTVIYNLALNEAIKRNRKINVFFLDQEAEYQSSIDFMRNIMTHKNIIPLWYQVPIYMTNATSFNEDMLFAWENGKKWIREKEKISIKNIDGEYPKRFYKFFEWFEKKQPDNSCFIIGLRAEEGINRVRAVAKNSAWNNIKWCTKTKNKSSFRFYPIYDWGMGDVWKYIYENNLEYNRIYDRMFMINKNFYNTMRVSNLIHEKSFYCLTDLQVLEPETYNKVIERIKGTHCASIYANDEYLYNNDKLPTHFKNWLEYRDYLLETTPSINKNKFINRFNKQKKDEDIYKQQCKQLLINDWEGNIPIDSRRVEKRKINLDKWRKIL